MRPTRRAISALLATVVALTLSVVTGISPSSPAGAAPVGGDERFVRRVYFDLVNDGDPDPAEIAQQVDNLDDVPTGTWLLVMLSKDSAKGAFVDDTYEAILDRPSDTGGRAYLVGRMNDGLSRQEVRAAMLASAEYFNGQGAGANSTWIDALYQDAFGRAADPGGKQYHLDRLAAGRSRSNVAASFVLSGEGQRSLVQSLYLDLVDRVGDPEGVNFFAGMLLSGTSVERVMTFMIDSSEYVGKASPATTDEELVLLVNGTTLVSTSVADIGTPSATVTVAGLTAATTLVGIDVRPKTGVLYGLGSDGQLYTVNPGSGFVTKVGTPIASFTPGDGVGFDFNPAADALRIVTGAQNYRLAADTGVVVGEGPAGSGTAGSLQYVDGDPNAGVTPAVSAAAYVNSTRGLPLPATTELYGIDRATSSLVEQNPANDGDLATVGRLRFTPTAVNGFDVSPDGTQTAFAALDAPNLGQGLYRIDLETGKPTLLSTRPGADVVGLAVIGTETVAPDETLYAVSAGQIPVLQTFSTNGDTPPASLLAGIDNGTQIVGLDVRPATGVLHALGSNGQIYTIDPESSPAAATKLGPPIAAFTPSADGVGFDFNPAADALRVVNGDDNYRVAAATGVVVGEGPMGSGTAGPLAYAPGDPNVGVTPAAGAAGYANPTRGMPLPAATALFDIDTDLDVLVRQNPANDGTLLTIGDLGVDVDANTSFDVSAGPGQTAYGVFTVGGAQGLYVIDLASGSASLLKALQGGALGSFAVA